MAAADIDPMTFNYDEFIASFSAVNVRGDGNCMLYAILRSLQISHPNMTINSKKLYNPETKEFLKDEEFIVFIRDNIDAILINVTDENKDLVRSSILTDGCYGEPPVAQALADFFDITINLFVTHPATYQQNTYKSKFGNTNNFISNIAISQNHYYALYLKTEQYIVDSYNIPVNHIFTAKELSDIYTGIITPLQLAEANKFMEDELPQFKIELEQAHTEYLKGKTLIEKNQLLDKVAEDKGLLSEEFLSLSPEDKESKIRSYDETKKHQELDQLAMEAGIVTEEFLSLPLETKEAVIASYFKQKYLKYKEKYLTLKKNLI